MLGTLLSGLATTLLPIAAKKLASIPIANQIFKTVSPIMSQILPAFTQNQNNDNPPPTVVIQKQTIQQPSDYQQQQSPQIRTKKYAKIKKGKYGRAKKYT